MSVASMLVTIVPCNDTRHKEHRTARCMIYRREREDSTNGRDLLDREVTSIRRELDQIQETSSDHATRIRSLELEAGHARDLIDQAMAFASRIELLEKSLRAVVWAMAVLCWKLAPDIAANLLALLPVRIG